MSRRSFLAKGSAACATALGALAAPQVFGASAPAGQPRIRIVYVLFGPKQPRPTWPHIGFDFVPVMNRIQAELTRRCPGFDFVSSLATGPDQAKKILDADRSTTRFQVPATLTGMVHQYRRMM